MKSEKLQILQKEAKCFEEYIIYNIIMSRKL